MELSPFFLSSSFKMLLSWRNWSNYLLKWPCLIGLLNSLLMICGGTASHPFNPHRVTLWGSFKGGTSSTRLLLQHTEGHFTQDKGILFEKEQRPSPPTLIEKNPIKIINK